MKSDDHADRIMALTPRLRPMQPGWDAGGEEGIPPGSSSVTAAPRQSADQEGQDPAAGQLAHPEMR